MLMRADRSVLLVVDVQERLAPAVVAAERVLYNIGRLLEAARLLGVPVIATEHYPRGLGATVPDVAGRLPAGSMVEKISFSAMDEQAFRERWAALGRDQVVVTGLEAHVCVLQTTVDLRADGVACGVVADAVSSRTAANAELGLERMRQNDAQVVTTEMILFEWLRRADVPVFKDVLRLIR